MNTTLRSILSSVTGIAALGFIVSSAFSTGFESHNTVLGMAGLVIWSLVQMLVLDFASSPVRSLAPPARGNASAIIKFPRPVLARQAA